MTKKEFIQEVRLNAGFEKPFTEGQLKSLVRKLSSSWKEEAIEYLKNHNEQKDYKFVYNIMVCGR